MRNRLIVVATAAFVSWALSWPVSAVPQRLSAQPPSSKRADAPYVKLPATKTVSPNRYFCLKPDTNCTSLKWIIPTGLDQLDPEIQLKDKNIIVLIGDAGTYVVQAYGALGDQASDLASCTITIGTPPPPTPPDPLTASLQTAFNQDADADKAKSLAFLQSVYAGMSDQAKSWTDVHTNADALVKMKAVVEAPSVGLTATQVQNLRKAMAAEFVKAFGTTATAPIDLTALSAELLKIANALKGIK